MKRGVSTIELLVAMFVAILALVTLIQVFSSHYKYSTMSRNRQVAAIVAHSLMDEVEAHPYGTPVPPAWNVALETPVAVWVEGRPQDLTFHKKIEFSGGFSGAKPDVTDLVTITLTWREGVGKDEVPGSDDDHQLVVEMPVWK